jgi:hypothetical protein
MTQSTEGRICRPKQPQITSLSMTDVTRIDSECHVGPRNDAHSRDSNEQLPRDADVSGSYAILSDYDRLMQ